MSGFGPGMGRTGHMSVFATHTPGNLPAERSVPARTGAHVQAIAAYTGGAAVAAVMVIE